MELHWHLRVTWPSPTGKASFRDDTFGSGTTFNSTLPVQVPIVTLLKVHPSREQDLVEPDAVLTEPDLPVEIFTDSFGNRGARVLAPSGRIRFHNSTLIRDSGLLDEQGFDAKEIPVQDLPHEVFPS